MRRQRAAQVGLGLTLVLGAALATPASRYPLVGVLGGERFFHGMPTSYWSSEIRSIRGLSIENRLPVKVQSLCYYLGVEFIFPYFDIYPSVRFIELMNDVEAVPVLIDLLKDEHADVRGVAAQALGGYGPEAANAISSLHQLLHADEAFVREHAASALHRIASDTAAEAGAR
jgi:hypothetical protein